MKLKTILHVKYLLPLLYGIVFLLAFLLGQFTELGECTGRRLLCYSRAFVIIVTLNAPGILIGGILNITKPVFVGLFSVIFYGSFGAVIDGIFGHFKKIKNADDEII